MDGTDGISTPFRKIGIAIAVAALLVTVYSLISLLTARPEVYGAQDTVISVSPGERFSIELDDNPGTGYRWTIESPAPDPHVLKPAGSHYDAREPVTAGSGGTRYLEFQAVREGRTELSLRHCFQCGTDRADPDRGGELLAFRVTVTD
ncbi:MULTISPECIES: protease inhibitor I42 family protein [Streptomyces]|uniref:Proteinase inhibitor I42 chagasin domain-containing protein n=1 Tax=Streptomyces olivaceiscleroticus TaxID=68245 RepID=A0ABP3K5J3_9ACTN|nr:protease inhibitor I42 family protein [Streptomyces niger]